MDEPLDYMPEPDDPDLDDAPALLVALDGTTVVDPDGNPAALVLVPGLWGHARRMREGFFDQLDDPDNRGETP